MHESKSTVIDNIPIMYAVLLINPTTNHGQWLLITLTAGVGGNLSSVGSAAGDLGGRFVGHDHLVINARCFT